MYIEREALLKAIDKLPNVADYCFYEDDVVEMARAIPAADVVEVVRCRDCAYSDDAWVNEKGFLICPASGMDISGDDFCSYGERRETDVH